MMCRCHHTYEAHWHAFNLLTCTECPCERFNVAPLCGCGHPEDDHIAKYRAPDYRGDLVAIVAELEQ